MLRTGQILLELSSKGVFDWATEKVTAFVNLANIAATAVAIIAFLFIAGSKKWTITGIVMGLVAGGFVIWLIPGGGLDAVGQLFTSEAK